jgi:hypothetical protein
MNFDEWMAQVQIPYELRKGARSTRVLPGGTRVEFMGRRSGRIITWFTSHKARQSTTNVVRVSFKPIDQAGLAYVDAMTRCEVTIAARKAGKAAAKGLSDEAVERASRASGRRGAP